MGSAGERLRQTIRDRRDAEKAEALESIDRSLKVLALCAIAGSEHPEIKTPVQGPRYAVLHSLYNEFAALEAK